ncbi:MAG: bacteriohemerythrin [Magnetococcales bacterium]|nr:bacteriohemerythrin [Magnetococcales bacterium]
MEISENELVVFFGQIPGFKNVPKGYLKQKVIPIIGISLFDPGHVIIKHGDLPHTLFIVYKGRGHGITTTPEGKEHHFFIYEGHLFGEFALVSNQRIDSTIRATSSMICLTVDIDTFQQIMMRDWQFSKAFFTLIGQRTIDQMTVADIQTFNWTDSLKIGIPNVDNQHKWLFDTINKLGKFLEESRVHTPEDNQQWVIQTLFSEIIDYVEKHFKEEERLMAQHDVPWLVEHQSIHRKVAEDVFRFKDQIIALSGNEEQLFMLEQMHKFMGDWLTHHIAIEDAKFGQFLGGQFTN